MNEVNDSRLLLLLCNEPQTGLAELLTAYGGVINAIVSRVLRQAPQDAEECAVDVLVAAWKNAEMLQAQQRSLKGWLCVTARNMALNRWYKLVRNSTVELNEELAGEWVLEWHSSDAEELIQALVESFGQPDKEIFIRRYYLLQPAKEIGKLLHMAENTVNAHLSRGRKKLKQQFTESQKEASCYE